MVSVPGYREFYEHTHGGRVVSTPPHFGTEAGKHVAQRGTLRRGIAVIQCHKFTSDLSGWGRDVGTSQSIFLASGLRVAGLRAGQ